MSHSSCIVQHAHVYREVDQKLFLLSQGKIHLTREDSKFAFEKKNCKWSPNKASFVLPMSKVTSSSTMVLGNFYNCLKKRRSRSFGKSSKGLDACFLLPNLWKCAQKVPIFRLQAPTGSLDHLMKRNANVKSLQEATTVLFPVAS